MHFQFLTLVQLRGHLLSFNPELPLHGYWVGLPLRRGELILVWQYAYWRLSHTAGILVSFTGTAAGNCLVDMSQPLGDCRRHHRTLGQTIPCLVSRPVRPHRSRTLNLQQALLGSGYAQMMRGPLCFVLGSYERASH